MPIYEYECAACGHRVEAIQKFNDIPLRECPACKAARLTRLISAPAFHLKGGGWYVTDFKDKSDKKPKDVPAEPSKPTESTTSTSTALESETKPAAKVDPASKSG